MTRSERALIQKAIEIVDPFKADPQQSVYLTTQDLKFVTVLLRAALELYPPQE